ncbi:MULTISPECIES: hypothetical protein [unclassified Psychrobacter]|uniref:hypothetical protein n=1 Tax=unclassified Psychrobacter TaxID=196806 RepID=UPI001D1887CE|nr:MULTISPECIES: hypothetical protein [unclassified Psychrobacter]
MVVSLARMLKSFSQSQDDAPTQVATALREAAQNGQIDTVQEDTHPQTITPLHEPARTERICSALDQVQDSRAPTPLTDRYLQNRANMRPKNRPPFDPNTLWSLRYGRCPIMTELIDVVNEDTLNAMPIEAVAILDRINNKLKRYRDWSSELDAKPTQNEKQFVIDKLVNESIPEALYHYEQLLRFSPHRTKNSTTHDKMSARDILIDLFLEIDYELDELLDELHQTVLNRLASTHRYVKSRTKN